jgi:hypothetical protein
VKHFGPRATPQEVARLIDDFLDGKSRPYDWDDFISIKIEDSYLDSVRKTCREVPEKYPADKKGHYCNAEGFVVLRALANEVRVKTSVINPS